MFFCKKRKWNSWDLKQYPKVNGAIVVLDPYSGNIKALVGGLILNQVNLIELPKQKDNQVLLLNQLFMQQH